MTSPEERAKRKTVKRIMEVGLFGATFSISFTLLDAIFFNNIYIFFAYTICVIMYGSMLVNYHLTFREKFLPLNYAVINLVSVAIITMTILTYLAGGFSGAMISGYFFIIIMAGLMLEKRQSIIVALIVITIYLTFMFGETFNFIIPVVTEPNIIKYSKAIIDLLSLGVAAFFLLLIAESNKNSINYFKLRSVRLSKMRKRLEFLVKRRTRELQNSNKKLKKSQKKLNKTLRGLKQLDEEKDHFISVAAHELKTPLTAITGYAQLLKRNKVIKNARKRNLFLDIVDNESKRLSQLVSEMLDLSRIDMGATRFNIEQVNIYDVMEGVEHEFRHKVEEKKLKYEFKLQRNLPKMATDKDKLHEIIINLVSNSLKYSTKGKIIVRVKKKGAYIEFSVSDNGPGISKKYHKKIFQRFFQVDASLSRDVGGTGLGLSIVKEHVEKMNGKIWLKSKKGKGATFFVKLPIKAKINAPKERIKVISK